MFGILALVDSLSFIYELPCITHIQINFFGHQVFNLIYVDFLLIVISFLVGL